MKESLGWLHFFLDFLMFSFESPNPSICKTPLLWTFSHCFFTLVWKKYVLRVSIFPPILYLAAICQTSIDFSLPPMQKITPTLRPHFSLFIDVVAIALGLNLYSALLRYITMINGYLINKPNPNWAPERNYQQAIGLHKVHPIMVPFVTLDVILNRIMRRNL